MKRSYTDYLDQKRAQYGPRFTTDALELRFVPYYQSGVRIKITRTYTNGDVTTAFGTVGVTTGWRPVFLLMSSTRAHGSSYVLGPDDCIVAERHGRTYRALTPWLCR